MTDTNKEREAAETWLRDRYGAYRGHFAWRELEEAFLAGRASLSAEAEAESIQQGMATVFRDLSDRAYCDYIGQMRRDVCLGWEHKAKNAKFGEAELKGHTKAGELLGRHKAFAEAADALANIDDFAATHPSPPEGAGWRPGQPITEAMHIAAVKVLRRASGLDGLPQRMLDAMIAAAPPASEAKGA